MKVVLMRKRKPSDINPDLAFQSADILKHLSISANYLQRTVVQDFADLCIFSKIMALLLMK